MIKFEVNAGKEVSLEELEGLEGFDLYNLTGTEDQLKLYRQLSKRIADKLNNSDTLTLEKERLHQMENLLGTAWAAACAGGAIFWGCD